MHQGHGFKRGDLRKRPDLAARPGTSRWVWTFHPSLNPTSKTRFKAADENDKPKLSFPRKTCVWTFEMTQATLVTFLLGVVLSRTFKVFALIPASGLIVFIAFFVSVVFSAPIAQLSMVTGIAIVSLQMGYLCGNPGLAFTWRPKSPNSRSDLNTRSSEATKARKYRQGFRVNRHRMPL